MIPIVRILPLLTLAALAATLVVPIFTHEWDDLVVTSLGFGVGLGEVHLPFVLVWVGTLFCAVSVWFVRRRWWSVVAIIVAAASIAFLVQLLQTPPIIMWDGVDDQGNPIGGTEISQPWIGVLLWFSGFGALMAAGVTGLLIPGNRRRQLTSARG